MTNAFQYVALADDHTRILTFSDASNSMSCTLEAYLDDSLPPFSALSYAWGNEAPTASILCNGNTFHVTPHLYSALRTITHLGCATNLWVDAICLNQRDNEEKSIHVPKMATIYRAANNVLAWLGPAGENSDLVVDQTRIDQISSAASVMQGQVAYSELVDRGLPGFTDPFWPALGKFCQRGWFFRLWVVQEIALGRENFMICGDRMVSYDSLALMMRHLTRLGCTNLMRGTAERGQQDQVAGLTTLAVHTLIRQWVASGSLSPVILLHYMRLKLVSKRVDRVYGALALLEPDLRNAITVDYSYEDSTWWKPYVQLGAYLVVRDASLGLLLQAPSKERPDGMPSWCPNFNSLYVDHQSLGGIAGYRAGYIQEEDRKSEIEMLPHDHIKAPGFEVDRVEAVVEFAWLLPPEIQPARGSSGEATRLLEWEEQCLELSRQAYGGYGDDDETTDVGVPEAHWRTLIVDVYQEITDGRYRSASPAPPEYKDSYFGLKEWWCSRRENEPVVNAGPNVPTRQYEQRLEFCRQMKFFKTQKNRVGMGPSDIRIGDRVVALYSASPLFILRDEPNEDCVKLVGDVYVYGCMNLQTMRDAGMETPTHFIIG